MMSSSLALRVTFIWMWMITVDRVRCAIVSWNKNVISSSTYADWVPARIIDGSQRTDAYICECCAGTEPESNPWYQLDLGKPYNVRKVEIKGRHDGSHFQDLRVFFKPITEINETMKGLTPVFKENTTMSYERTNPKLIQYVTLMRRNVIKDKFVVCELIVHGECDGREFGYYCDQTCHCDGDPCNKTSGICPSGQCLAGYKGQACDKVCRDGYYGAGCTKTCGNCSGTEICDKTTGLCPGSCSPGYQGRFCKTICRDGYYGAGCTKTCGNCSGTEICDKTTGLCPGNCSPGYQGRFCKTRCMSGTYGEGGLLTCQSCENGTFCNRKTGVCAQGDMDQDTDDGSDTMYVLAISGWTFGGVVLIVAVGIGIFIWIRRRKAPATTGTVNQYDRPNRNPLEEEHPYSCSANDTQEPPYSRSTIDTEDTNPIYINPVHINTEIEMP